MVQQRIYDWIKHPECLNRETLYELRTLLARYPYFQTARLLYLKNLFLLHDLSFGEELRKSPLFIIDRRTLFSLIEGDRYTFKELEKEISNSEVLGVDRTLSLIDSFLSNLPNDGLASEKIPVAAVDVTSDYLSYLMQQPDAVELEAESESTRQMKGQELIDSFLEKSEEEPIITKGLGDKEVVVIPEEQEDSEELIDDAGNLDDESYFTETLAKIYVKQQRYSKAIEIIKKLNLKYPKKNAYFADQIRFLEKLIINTKSK